MAPFTHTKMRYTVDEACKLLSIKRTHLYKIRKLGALAYVKDGRRTYITAAALDAYMDRR